MEYTQWDNVKVQKLADMVLILVVMEYTQWAMFGFNNSYVATS